MTDTLLIVATILLLIMIGLLIFLILDKKKDNQKSSFKDDVRGLFEESRVNSLKDFIESVKTQNNEIQVLKDAVTNGMSEAQKHNQTDLYKFLEETKTKLTDLQLNFNKESSEVKQQNSTSIKDLVAQTTKDLNELKSKILSEINDTNQKNNTNINQQNVKTQEQITSQIQTLKEQVQKSLEQGFEKNEKAIHEFIEKTASIEASTRQIEELRKEINKFNNILSNQKSRGNFGEDVLEQILTSIFGDPSNNYFYRTQVDFTKEFSVKQLKDDLGEKKNVIVDFLFNISTDHGTLPLSIDAKFPYVNYLPMLDETISIEEKNEAKKRFRNDIKARIKEVTKYIVDGKTAPYAIMFVPAEAVFIDIFKEFPDIVEESRKQKIIIASPSLIITIIQILQFILRDYHLRNNADEILNLIDDLGKQFVLFSKRWDIHKNRVEKLVDDIKDIDITSKNLVSQFDKAKNLVDEKSIALEIESLALNAHDSDE
ncbi:MAG: DNA recombination protein RmuC [Acholeplasmataceae bacterium]|jgi:DNA recombination protein RmuC|nr:DNA recombination protein RmuC [Acholeplasmataceae bacterium]